MRTLTRFYCCHPSYTVEERRDRGYEFEHAAERTAARSSTDTVAGMLRELKALPPASTTDYWTSEAWDRCHAFARRAALLRRKRELDLHDVWYGSLPLTHCEREALEAEADDLWAEANDLVKLIQRQAYNRWNQPGDKRPAPRTTATISKTWDERIAEEDGPHLFCGDLLTWGSPDEDQRDSLPTPPR